MNINNGPSFANGRVKFIAEKIVAYFNGVFFLQRLEKLAAAFTAQTIAVKNEIVFFCHGFLSEGLISRTANRQIVDIRILQSVAS